MTSNASNDWKPSPRQVLAQANAKSRNYDQIAYHVRLLSQRDGGHPFNTLTGVERQLVDAERTSHDAVTSELFFRLRERLAHRSIDIPNAEGRFRYEIVGSHMLRLIAPDAKTGEEQEWIYSLTRPPAVFADHSQLRDAPPLMSQRLDIELPGIRWLPLTTLIKAGRLQRMQEWAAHLGNGIGPGRFYTFVSHRWLTPTHPDPEGLQAGLIAWQMLAHLCEAIFVARLRGLHKPRQFSPDLHVTIGIGGSELAECLLVNVVRHCIDEQGLPKLFDETQSLEQLFEDKGLEAAAEDLQLQHIRGLLAERPLLTECASRINIWYDYSCMPQEPRTPTEQQQFEEGLARLNAVQLLGHSVVLLDQVTDYLCRAWCVLESVFADSVVPTPLQILHGSTVARADRARAERDFREVLRDRPHLIWRAILDTEVFRIQSPTECMQRLALGTTRPQDLSFVYGALRKLRTPRSVHSDPSELLTGCFPLPITADGNSIALARIAGRDIEEAVQPEQITTLDWSACLDFEAAWIKQLTDKTPLLPAMMTLTDTTTRGQRLRSPCHVAIIASCEGEAVVYSDWVRSHLTELEATTGRTIETMSWLASDIAPVGHFKDGNLTFDAVDPETWVLAALSARLTYCCATALLRRSLQFAGKVWFELALDLPNDNLTRITTTGAHRDSAHECTFVPRRDFEPRRLPGGVFQEDLLGAIARNAQPVRSAQS